MASVASMAVEEAAANPVAGGMLDPISASGTLLQLPDAPSVPAAGPSSQSVQPPGTPDCSVSREQVPVLPTTSLSPVVNVTLPSQHHLAESEGRVSQYLLKAVETAEVKLLQAVQQAAIDIVDNIAEKAERCILVSQHNAYLLACELNRVKQQALSMLAQVKQTSAAQIADAENKYLIERKRAQEAEAKLHTVQESTKKLKAELKRKGHQGEEFQKGFYPETGQPGLQVSVTDGSGSRKGGNRSKGSAGDMRTQQASNARNQAFALAMSAGVATFDRSSNGVAEVQTENYSTRSIVPGLIHHDAHTDTRVQMGLLVNEVHPQGKSNLEGKGDSILTDDGHASVSKLHSQQDSPTHESASLAGEDNISVQAHQPHSSSEDSPPSVTQVYVSPPILEKGQLTSSLKVDLESRSAKDSDEEKSSLSVEALYCNDETLPPPVHALDEYQFTEEQREGLGTQGRSEGSGKVGQEIQTVTNGMDTVVAYKSVSKMPDTLPVTAKLNSDAHFSSSPMTKSALDHSNHPNEDTQGPEAQCLSAGNQVSKRKRKQTATVQKYDLSSADRSPKRLEAEGAGACGVLGPAGVDANLSSRDNRRLMQGARQLFSLSVRR